ncbi:MAG TPA: hypothetical protein VFH27_03800, partial [Longimicrobiaceae bacterium]|nr:hypothetical protein [Longimicrobiaceae bacterium]
GPAPGRVGTGRTWMKSLPLMVAGLVLGLPAPAHAAGACDQLTGTYTGSRIGDLAGNPQLLAFDRLRLRAGAGDGRQVQVASATAPAGDQIDLLITCAPVDATHATLTVKSHRVGSSTPFTDAGSVSVTVLDGGSRLRIVGNTPPGSMPGWLFRLPSIP